MCWEETIVIIFFQDAYLDLSSIIHYNRLKLKQMLLKFWVSISLFCR